MDLSSPLRDAKALGAFYTPESLAEALADWVLADSDVKCVLEPSAGDGALISAARAMASGRSIRFVACDIDRFACAKLRTVVGKQDTVLERDFLSLEASEIGRVDAVLANPPFIRNHDIPNSRRNELRGRFKAEGAAGLWVYFLLHSLSFLKTGGRLAFVVPGSALFTRYGRSLIQRTCEQFSTVAVKRIAEWPVWVNGAEERGAILFASGFQEGQAAFPDIGSWQSSPSDAPVVPSRPVSRELEDVSRPIGSLARFSIGVVTGANKLFLLSERSREAEGIPPDEVVPIISRSRQLLGLKVTKSDLLLQGAEGEHTLLLAPRDAETKRTPVRKRLARVSHRRRIDTTWLNKRSPWWKVDLGPECDAVFTHMNHLGPRLVLAGEGVRCTNTLHRVNFNIDTTVRQRNALALSMVSTFGQLAAERVGRSYGGGVLKFELYEARSMPVLVPPEGISDSVLELADAAVRAGRWDLARAIADEALLTPVIGKSWAVAASDLWEDLRLVRGLRNRRSSSADV